MPETAAPQPQKLGKEQIELLKRTHCKDWTDDEVALFVYQCDRTGLDPLTRQIYGKRHFEKKTQAYKLSVQTSIDGFRLVAERTGKYAGQTEPLWCGADGVWKDVWLEKFPPSAAKIGVHREGFKEPLMAVANFDAYAQKWADGSLSGLWAKMDALMISKCAEALALRKAFPQELSGLYTSDEMMQAESETPAEKAKRSSKAAAEIPGATSAHAEQDGEPPISPEEETGNGAHTPLPAARPNGEGRSGPKPPGASTGLAGSKLPVHRVSPAPGAKADPPIHEPPKKNEEGEIIPIDQWELDDIRKLPAISGKPLGEATEVQLRQIVTMGDEYIAHGRSKGKEEVAIRAVDGARKLLNSLAENGTLGPDNDDLS